MNEQKFLETPELLLRRIVRSDANDIFEYSREYEVGLNAGWKPFDTIEETLNVMDMMYEDRDGMFAIVPKSTGKLIGIIGITDDPKRENPHAGMLGFSLAKSYWNRGIMTEAAKAVIQYGFSAMELTLISSYCYPYNSASKRVLEKCGFVYEGILHACEERFDGKILDNLCYYLVRE